MAAALSAPDAAPIARREWLEALAGFAAIGACAYALTGFAGPESWTRLAALALLFALAQVLTVRLSLRLAAAVPLVAAVAVAASLPTALRPDDPRLLAAQLCIVLLAGSVVVTGLLVERLRRAVRAQSRVAAELAAANARLQVHARAVAAGEATLNAVLDALPVGVVIADAQGGVVRDNAAHHALWGVPPRTTHLGQYGQYVGRRDGVPIAPEEWAMARALLRGEVVRDELVECERFDGRGRRLFLNNAAPVRAADGAVVGAVTVELDVTERHAAERRFREAAERVQLALDAGAIVGTWNWELPNDRFTADARFARSFGLDPERCRAGLGIDEVTASIHAEDLPRVQAAIAEAIARGGPYRCEYRVLQHDGVHRWIEANGRVHHAPDGTPLRFPGVLLDVEARRRNDERLRRGEARFRAAVEAASDILWTNDPDGQMRGEQPGWAAFTGQVRAEYENFGWTRALHPDDVERTVNVWRTCVETGAKYAIEHRVRRRDGVYRTLAGRALPVRDADGRLLEWVGVHTDITDLRAAESYLKAADRRKDEFIATLAHELRNPLAPIRNALQILNRSEDPAVAQQARAMMGRQVGQLVRLVDDLLDVSRIASGKLKLDRERVDVRRVLDQAIETARPAIDARGHRLLVEPADRDYRVHGDAVRLAQIVTNLLNNAAKYSEPGGRITVRVRGGGNDRVQIAVEDTGIGLAPESLARVFDLFAQIEHGADKAQGGLGIGLALAQRLAAMHGGELRVASDGIGRGATFTLELPTAPPLIAAAAGARVGPPGGVRRVLVVDDNRDAADSLAIVLKLQGHEVATCYDGRTAIDVIRAQAPDVAIVDLGMPGCDGFEVARKVRANRAGDRTRLVALTGWGQVDDKRRTHEAGFDHHYTKPVEFDALLSVIEAPLPAG